MTFDQDIAGLRARIAKAVSDREHWRRAGNQEKYIEAYSIAETLDRELDLLRRAKFEAAMRNERVPPANGSPAAKADGVTTTDAEERARLMAAFSITYNGRQYQYAQYRYDRLDDAVDYATQQLLSPSAGDAADSLPPPQVVEAPDALERKRMSRYGITFQDGVYRLGPYRYDRLADAMRYARLDEPVRRPIVSFS